MLAGASEITILGADGDRADLLRQLLAENAGKPKLRVKEVYPRTYLRALDSRCGVIHLVASGGGALQLGGRASGGQSLFTAEAFRLYLDHLLSEGRLVIQLTDERDLCCSFGAAFSLPQRTEKYRLRQYGI